MPYATLAQLTDRFGERMLVARTDRGVIARETIDTAVVNRAIADTDAVIDGYLKVRYVLPLVPVPALVGDLAQALVIYKLHTAAPDATILKDYEDARKTLREISQGMVQLDSAGVEPATSDSGGARMTDRERPLSADQMTGFI